MMGYQMVVRLIPANWQPRSQNDSEAGQTVVNCQEKFQQAQKLILKNLRL
jgi:hypothetical protein